MIELFDNFSRMLSDDLLLLVEYKSNVFRLMKLAEKLVNKSIYLQILSHTKSEDILRMYVELSLSLFVQ